MSRTVSVALFLKKQRSDNTRKLYGKVLKRFFVDTKLTQKKFLNMDIEDIEDTVEDFKDNLINIGLAGETVKVHFKGIKSFLKANRIHINTKCTGVSEAKKTLDYIPNQYEVKRLIEEAKLTYKVFICLIAFGGIRPKDVRELTYASIKRSYEAKNKVLTILLKQSKTKAWYFTFLGVQGTNYLRELIEKRRAGYTKTKRVDTKILTVVIPPEPITDDTLIFSENGKMISEYNVLHYMRRLITRTVGVSPTNEPFRRFRTYGLRKYFKRWSRVLGADESEFLMGHAYGARALSATYSGLADLDQTVIDELKNLYIENLPSLETEITDITIKSELDNLKTELKTYKDENTQLKARLNRFESPITQKALETLLENPTFLDELAQKLKEKDEDSP